MSNNPRPLFIVGAARSGTSYLHGLFNLHPQIRLSYESRLPFEGYQCYRREPNLESLSGFNRFLNNILSMEGDEDKNRWLYLTIDSNRKTLFEKHLNHESFPEFVKDVFQLAGDPVACFGNKMLRAELCPEIEKLWPHARFIVLVRDPRAVVASQIKRFRGRRLAYAAIYCDTHFKWTRKLTRNHDNYLLLSYEAFVKNPDLNLDRILKFAGLPDPFHQRVMLSKKTPHKASIKKWRQVLSSSQIKQIESYCFDTMTVLGYLPEQAEKQKTVSRVEKSIELGYEKREAFFYGPVKWQQKKIFKRFFNIIKP